MDAYFTHFFGSEILIALFLPQRNKTLITKKLIVKVTLDVIFCPGLGTVRPSDMDLAQATPGNSWLRFADFVLRCLKVSGRGTKLKANIPTFDSWKYPPESAIWNRFLKFTTQKTEIVGNNAFDSRKFEPNPDRISNFVPIFESNLRISMRRFDSKISIQSVGSKNSNRRVKFEIRNKFEGSTALLPSPSLRPTFEITASFFYFQLVNK